MEAPLAIFETPKPNMNFQNKKSFKLEADNAKYILSLSYNDKLIFFEIEKDGEFPKKEYNLFLDLDQLYKINKYFVQFENFADIQNTFATVSSVGNHRYVFNIKGNDYRLIVLIKFTISHVLIRFVGTHEEYDKIKDIQNL